MKNETMINVIENELVEGNVKITMLKNDKVLSTTIAHNHGTQALCRYLRNALAGYNTIADRPGIIIPCLRGAGNSLVDIGLGTALFNDMPKESDDDTSSSCTLTFLIPSNILSANSNIVGFRLYSKKTKTLFAEIDLEKNGVEPIEVVSGSNLRVEWTLTVKLSTKGLI